MKYTFQLLCSLVLLIAPYHFTNAQGTETFEMATVGATSFTNNGQTFNLTTNAPAFFIANFAGLGYGASNRFIHLNDSYGSVSAISVPSGSFKLNNFWFYVTGNAEQDPGAPNPSTGPGSVTFTGIFRGATQFSFTKTTGFATTFALPGNGFGLIDFSTEGGTDNTNVSIDQLQITLSSNFDYFAIDNFNWTQGALPVTFGSITASVTNENGLVTWETLSENNNDHFEVQVSTDGKAFTTVASVVSKAPGGSSDKTITYEAGLNFKDAAATAGMYLASLLLLGVAHVKRRRFVPALMLALGVAGGLGCSKNNNGIPVDGEKYYLRIAQVDKDGGRTFSKIVIAERTN
ncbi:hypothetical protein U0035_02980 [Niabella yanshanensis]|uniref:Uncharacterized protein n=1 Tax=Niabella yanshanensis TaxID=577386 RepID=A0ABZ0W761_9BACT|nr:hypothetical protein [Niabella yanshanensis]WQD39110.1 hypothetical protein U0035_02980 [Niabella yanshanensis]